MAHFLHLKSWRLFKPASAGALFLAGACLIVSLSASGCGTSDDNRMIAGQAATPAGQAAAMQKEIAMIQNNPKMPQQQKDIAIGMLQARMGHKPATVNKP